MEGVNDLQFGRVLAVDDDPHVLRVLARMLRRFARETLTAASCDEGLEKLNGGGIDLLVVDVHLGERHGVELARAAAHLHPAPAVVAVTGAASPEDGLHLGRAGVATLLEKPFTLEHLRSALAQLEPPQPVELEAVIRRLVGVRPMPEVLDTVRRSMVREALARSGETKSHAAGMLGISRQHLSKIIERGKV